MRLFIIWLALGTGTQVGKKVISYPLGMTNCVLQENSTNSNYIITNLKPPGHSVQTLDPFLLYVPFSQACSPWDAKGHEFPAVHSWHSVCPTVSVYVPLKHGKGLSNGSFGQ